MPGSITRNNSIENGQHNGILKVSVRKNVLVDSMGSQSEMVWNKKVPNTQMEKLKKVIEEKYNKQFDSYWDLHRWSVENFSEFWGELWEYFDVIASKPYDQLFRKTGSGFLDNEWFGGALFNYAENLLRIRDDRVALICADELGNEEKVTYAEMYEEVKLYAAAFRKLGLTVGDRVACYTSNRKEPIFAMLAAASIGAIWSGPLPYYGARAAKNVVQMMEPKILLSVDHLIDDGEHFYPINNLPHIVDGVSSIEKVIIVATEKSTLSRDISNIPNSVLLEDFLQTGRTPDGTVPDITFEQLPFDHPICINFTSGTTGLPKGPVHSAGTLLTVLRDFAFHLNIESGNVIYSCYPVGWSLWDYHLPSFALGSTLFLYDGSPYFKSNDGANMWSMFSQHKVTFAFLVSSMIDKLEKKKILPLPNDDLEHLKVLAAGGSPVKRQNFDFLRKIKKDLYVGSLYGATETFGAFSGFEFNTPVHAGEIQVPALGVDLKCLDHNGYSVIGQRGEMVVGTPSPSFPLYLWKDEGNKRMQDAYFSKYNDVWCQNDECWIHPKTNGIVVIGRSDDTLKQNGERFGSGDIYFAIHEMDELEDYICVGQDGIDGDTRAVLFVKLRKGQTFTPELKEKIERTITREFWMDFVPQVIMETPDVPYNLNNKRMESVVRKIIATNKIPDCMNIRNPQCLRFFCDIPELINYTKSCTA